MLKRQYSDSTLNFVITMDDADAVQIVPTCDAVAIVTGDAITSYAGVPVCGTSLETAMSYSRCDLHALVQYKMEAPGESENPTTASLDTAAAYTCLTPMCGEDTDYIHGHIRSGNNIKYGKQKCDSISHRRKINPYPNFSSIMHVPCPNNVTPQTATVDDNKSGLHHVVLGAASKHSAGHHPNESRGIRNDGRCSQGMDTADNAGQSAIMYPTAKSFMESANIGGPCEQTLMDATEEALVSGTLTPLIKEELKYSIQSRRLKEGKSEMQVEFRHPEEYQLSKEEVQKVETRRVQNRMAARRFRDRQKDRGETLQKHCQHIESMNTELRYELNELKKERDELKVLIQEHLSGCPSTRQTFTR